MLLRRSSFVIAAAFAITGLCANAQTPGTTRNVTVPFHAESWYATARTASTITHQQVHAPQYQLNAQQLHKSGAMAARAVTGAASTGSNIVLQVFPGPVDGVPPDSQIAAGPNHLVAAVNSILVVYDKHGTQISLTSIPTFFGAFNTRACCFDPRVLFDQTSGRFVFVASRNDGTSSDLYIAVSATSDPTGTWYKYAINSSSVFWSDFPSVGVGPSALYISTDRIPFSPGSAAWDVTVIGLPELLAGQSNLVITDFTAVNSPQGPIVPAITFGASDVEYLVSNGSPGTINVYWINTSGPLSIKSGTIQTASFTYPQLGPQPGTTQGLNPGADQVFTPVWRNGSLWFTQPIGGDASGIPLTRWYEVDPVQLAVRQFGEVSIAGATEIPALTVRPDGGVDIVFSTSSTTQFASAAFAHRDAGDPPGTMPIQGIYKAGVAPYTASTRWGDVSGIAVDPDGQSVWGMAEYAQATNFGTSIVQLGTPAPPAPSLAMTASPAAQTITAGQAATVTISVQGQSLSAPVSFACSGLPAAAACAFNPGSVSVGANGASTTLTITTTARTSAMLRGGWMWFAIVPFGFAMVLYRTNRRRLAIVSSFVAIVLMLACGGVAGKATQPSPPPQTQSGTPPGSYAVTVTGTSGSMQSSATVTVQVQ